jgi:hypothetical protein
MVDGLDASQNTRKGTVKPPIPAFSNTSQHKGILEEQGLLAFLKTDALASTGEIDAINAVYPKLKPANVRSWTH